MNGANGIDWQAWRWQRPGAEAGSWRVTVTSDWAPLRAYEPLMLRDPEAVYGDLLEILRASDLNITNVEAVLGDPSQPIPKAGPALKGDPRTVRALTEAKFEVGCLANNHAMDFGPEGLRQTLDVLGEAGIETLGAGFDEAQIRRPVVREVQGVKVGLINCAEGESGRSVHGEPGVHGLDVTAVRSQIAELKESGAADVVLVIFHGGREYIPVPAPYVVRDMRQIAEGGADAVVAHHPHVPQATEIHQGVPITYSPGNFVFWLGAEYLYRRIGYLVHLDFAGKQLVGVELTPYVLQPEGLRQMQGAAREWFAERLAAATAPMQRMADVRAVWSAFADAHGCDALLAGLKRLIAGIESGEDVPGHSAKLKNLFFTPAHHEMHSELLARVSQGGVGTAPAWAAEMVQDWGQTRFEELPELTGEPSA